MFALSPYMYTMIFMSKIDASHSPETVILFVYLFGGALFNILKWKKMNCSIKQVSRWAFITTSALFLKLVIPVV
jgi:hypothetical protein